MFSVTFFLEYSITKVFVVYNENLDIYLQDRTKRIANEFKNHEQ